MAELLLGKPVAEQIFEEIAQWNYKMRLAAIGLDNPAWKQYVAALQKSGEKCNVAVESINLQGKSPKDFCATVRATSARQDISGVILQQPLPIDYVEAAYEIPPEKDVDCISDAAVAALYRGEEIFAPATPKAVLKLLKYYGVDLLGKHVVIVGRGAAVGKPLALMCLREHATITVCHTKTQNLANLCKTADILISACGAPGLITRDFVTENSIVVDVGLSFVDGKTCGDVAEEVKNVAKAVSPVPGGVGPVTRAALFSNLVSAVQIKGKR